MSESQIQLSLYIILLLTVKYFVINFSSNYIHCNGLYLYMTIACLIRDFKGSDVQNFDH